jgi:hypothetical protein
MKSEKEIKAKSKEQRTKSDEQIVTNKGLRVICHCSLVIWKQMPLGTLFFNPEKSVRVAEFTQLKQKKYTAITANSCQPHTPVAATRISTVFYYKKSGDYCLDKNLSISGVRAVRACLFPRFLNN